MPCARLEEVLGPEHAVTLMTHMPTEPDLATKADLVTLNDRLDVRFGTTDARIAAIDARLDRLEAHMVRFDTKLDGFHEALRDQSRTYMLTMTGVMASFAAAVVATGILN